MGFLGVFLVSLGVLLRVAWVCLGFIWAPKVLKTGLGALFGLLRALLGNLRALLSFLGLSWGSLGLFWGILAVLGFHWALSDLSWGSLGLVGGSSSFGYV